MENVKVDVGTSYAKGMEVTFIAGWYPLQHHISKYYYYGLLIMVFALDTHLIVVIVRTRSIVSQKNVVAAPAS